MTSASQPISPQFPASSRNLPRHPAAAVSDSSRISWLVFRLRDRTDQQVGPRLDRVRQFLEVFADIPEIVQHFIDIFGIHIDRLVEPPRQACHSAKSLTQLKNGLMN